MDQRPAHPAPEPMTGTTLKDHLADAGIGVSAVIPDDVGLLLYLSSDGPPPEDTITLIERMPGVDRVERRHNRHIVRVHPTR